MMLPQRLFVVRTNIHNRCTPKPSVILPLKTFRSNWNAAVNNTAFKSKCINYKTSDTISNSCIFNSNGKTNCCSSIIFHLPGLQIQRIHTGKPNYTPLPKIPFLLFVRPLISIIGNILTRLWKRLDPNTKMQIKTSIKQFKLLLPLFAILSIICIYLYYQQNVEEVDILGIKRKRFIILRTSQLDALASLAKSTFYLNQRRFLKMMQDIGMFTKYWRG